jgi:hypothetical protein
MARSAASSASASRESSPTSARALGRRPSLTDRLPDLFQARWKYSLAGNLPALREPLGDWKKIRHNYYQVLLEQFIERWGRPYYEYCERNGLEFTGHYWEHEWPDTKSVPDNMAMSAWQQRPGIDTLMNQYQEDPHAQFGNVRAVKESRASRAARGRARCRRVTAPAGGTCDSRNEAYRRLPHVLRLTLDHISYDAARRPQARSPAVVLHTSRGGTTTRVCDYFARLSVAMSSGQQVNDVLLLEPTTTAWMYNAAGTSPAELEKLGDSFQRLEVALEHAQVEYDLGAEDILARHGSVQGRALRVGRRDYRIVVLPPMTENLNGATADLLEQFVKAGGTVLACAPPPGRIDGAASDRGAALARLADEAGRSAVAALLLSSGGPCHAAFSGSVHHRRLTTAVALQNTAGSSAGMIETRLACRGVGSGHRREPAVRLRGDRPGRPFPIRPA